MSATQAAGNPIHDTKPYPLPESLTRRILAYLGIYRLVIALLLLTGHFISLPDDSFASVTGSFANMALISYLLFSAFELFMARRVHTDAHHLVRYALLSDVLFLSVLLFALGGLNSGVGLLLTFCGALAGMLLPLRLALFLASVASLSMISQAVVFPATPATLLTGVLSAGLYGATAMIACLLSHRLAFWARDYRLIAEKQQTKIADLRGDQ